MTVAQIASFALAVALTVSFIKFPTYYIKDNFLQNQVVRLLVFVVAFVACILYDPSVGNVVTLVTVKQALLDSFQVGGLAIASYHVMLGLTDYVAPMLTPAPASDALGLPVPGDLKKAKVVTP